MRSMRSKALLNERANPRPHGTSLSQYACHFPQSPQNKDLYNFKNYTEDRITHYPPMLQFTLVSATLLGLTFYPSPHNPQSHEASRHRYPGGEHLHRYGQARHPAWPDLSGHRLRLGSRLSRCRSPYRQDLWHRQERGGSGHVQSQGSSRKILCRGSGEAYARPAGGGPLLHRRDARDRRILAPAP